MDPSWELYLFEVNYQLPSWKRADVSHQEIWSWWSSDAKDPRSRAPWTCMEGGNSMGPSLPNFKRPPLLAAEPNVRRNMR
jgi:hypothetical protein